MNWIDGSTIYFQCLECLCKIFKKSCSAQFGFSLFWFRQHQMLIDFREKGCFFENCELLRNLWPQKMEKKQKKILKYEQNSDFPSHFIVLCYRISSKDIEKLIKIYFTFAKYSYHVQFTWMISLCKISIKNTWKNDVDIFIVHHIYFSLLLLLSCSFIFITV